MKNPVVLPYCLVNTHNDIIATFRFSETAHEVCNFKNKSCENTTFFVKMTVNVLQIKK